MSRPKSKPTKNAVKSSKHPAWLVFGQKTVLLSAVGLSICVLAFVGYLFLTISPITTFGSKTPQLSQNDSSTAPISLIPKQPGGVTIVEKMPELPEQTTAAVIAPTAQGSAAATGYALDLGGANSFAELTDRFATVAEMNNTSLFAALEPRALLLETATGLQARLLVGPVESFTKAEQICQATNLPDGLSCSASEFAGELIPRSF